MPSVLAAVLAVLSLLGGGALADVPVITVLADFEDDSVAAEFGELRNILPTECSTARRAVPARGQFCLALDIGATRRGVSLACDLQLREPERFASAGRVAMFYWLKEGEYGLAFRIRDARDQLFETPLQQIKTYNRWVPVAVDLDPAKLQRKTGGGPLTWPIEIQGVRVTSERLGRQMLYLDDLHVEHRVAREDMIHGRFVLDEPTRLYSPGATVGAQVEIENRSRDQGLRLSIELAWMRPDGSVLETGRAVMTLPASGRDFRSRQAVDFSRRIDEPGLYQLVARAQSADWSAPYIARTSVAVTPSNRFLPRGRSTFFGVRTDLLREPRTDQLREIGIARAVGVQLLAVVTPWRLIEPAPGSYDFSVLDPVVDALVRKGVDIAPLIIVSEPPAWSRAGPERTTRLGDLLVQFTRHYGPKVAHYQVEGDVLPTTDVAALTADMRQLRERVGAVRGGVHVLSPPLPAGANSAAALAVETGDIDWCFGSTGSTGTAVAALEGMSATSPAGWRSNHWWEHEAQPLYGPTYAVDAEAVLRHYVHAALAGVAGVIWDDLRDNDNDPAHPAGLRGLARRDFSPKASLLGYGAAVGMLTGAGCRGPLLGTPPEYESALFIGSDRHVAVLLPRPNTIPNAVLAPIQGVPGSLEAWDFERRRQPVRGTATVPLVATMPRPIFIVLRLDSAQPEPQIALVRPWVRVPTVVFCAPGESAPVAIDALTDGTRGSLQVILPEDAPFNATPSQQSFTASAGQTVERSVEVTPVAGRSFERSELTLRVRLPDRRADVPVEVRPIVDIPQRSRPGEHLTRAENLIGRLAPQEGQRATAEAEVYAAYDEKELHLAVRVSDERYVPATLEQDVVMAGDDLVLGLAVRDAPGHYEVRLDPAAKRPVLSAAYAALDDARIKRWSCAVEPGSDGKIRVYHLTIPGGTLGGRLEPGLQLRLAARYVDDDADGFPRVPLLWGRGLEGQRSAELFCWVRLGRAASP
ncbi:MAG: beta-galactosidase [Phycisphaerae bacterium]|jgi:hypothetical protein